MKIGYYVEGDADKAFVEGVTQKYCSGATLTQAKFRGRSITKRLKKELRKALLELSEKHQCEYFVVLVDANNQKWRDVKKNEWVKVPEEFEHMTVYGVAERNIECWLAIDRDSLAKELDCSTNEIPKDDPSDFIKSKFRVTESGLIDKGESERIRNFVAAADFRTWIKRSESFKDFWKQIYDKGKDHNDCIPNEQQNPD